MKKALIIIMVLGLLVAFFFPKEYPVNSTRKCFGIVKAGVETADAQPTGPSVSIPNMCFGIILGKETINNKAPYQFVKDYKVKIVVGGVVGVTEKTYHVGDMVSGEETAEGIKVRIAQHSSLNDGKPSPNSYQEFIWIPNEYVKMLQSKPVGDVDVYY